METANVMISLAPAVVALGALAWAMVRDRRTDVRQSLTSIENGINQRLERFESDVNQRLGRIETDVKNLGKGLRSEIDQKIDNLSREIDLKIAPLASAADITRIEGALTGFPTRPPARSAE